MQKPSIGRIVIYREGDYELAIKAVAANAPAATPESIVEAGRGNSGTNGTREHPAVITRVWSETCVNLHVLFDANRGEVRSSVTLLPELAEGVEDTSGNSGWRWPDRV